MISPRASARSNIEQSALNSMFVDYIVMFTFESFDSTPSYSLTHLHTHTPSIQECSWV